MPVPDYNLLEFLQEFYHRPLGTVESGLMGQTGQLVQVVGQSFQQVEYRTVFLLYPLLHSPIGDELPHDLDGLLTRLPGQSLEPEM